MGPSAMITWWHIVPLHVGMLRLRLAVSHGRSRRVTWHITLNEVYAPGRQCRAHNERHGLSHLPAHVIRERDLVALVAGVPRSTQHFVLQTAHARPSFRNKSFYDNAIVIEQLRCLHE